MNNIIEDIAFVKSIIPETYAVKESQTKGSIHCVSAPNTGFKKPGSDADDEEKWNIFFNTIKSHFGERFQETYCNTCTWYQDFIIYLKPLDDGQEGRGLRWVKASERLPKEYKHVFLRLDKNALRIGYHGNGEWQNEDELFLNKENIEWLDESAALPVADGEGAKRLISMVERRMKKAGIIDILIDRLPGKEYSQLIYNFFESLREIDEPIINGNS